MYFKISMRHNPAGGKMDGYYRLVESYRNADERVCHRTLLNVGFLDDEVTVDQLNHIRRRLVEREQLLRSGPSLFEWEKSTDPVVNRFVEDLWTRLIKEERIDTGEAVTSGGSKNNGGRDWQTIDMNSMAHADAREIGVEWLCYQCLEQLGVSECLRGQGWDEDSVRLALTHIISRAAYPASELCTSRRIRENSAVCEVTGFPLSRINKDCLYRIIRRLYGIHAEMEKFLSQKTNELFDFEDKIILYDLTNTYYEGQMPGSRIAKHGRSKEKRSDCKLIVLGLVVNQAGFIKYSGLLEGNISDPATMGDMVRNLREKTSLATSRAIVVMDAGIATEANLAMLCDNGFDYLCVTRSSLKKYRKVSGAETVCVADRKNRKIQLEKVVSDKDENYYLKVESTTKKEKERSMNELFSTRFEEGLKRIAESLTKKGGIKQEDKVMERIGRLKGKYPSIHRYYDISFQTEVKPVKKRGNKEMVQQRTVRSLRWKLKDNVDVNERSGIYFLRTSIRESEKILWNAYNTIREVESTIRCLKSDLDLRPIYHKKDESSPAHLNLGLLAYWVVNTIRYQLKRNTVPTGTVNNGNEPQDNSIHDEWREIVRTMNRQKAVTTMVQNKKNEVIILRQCTAPNEKVKRIYDKLAYRQYPFKKKKFVVHKSIFEKMQLNDIQQLYTQ